MFMRLGYTHSVQLQYSKELLFKFLDYRQHDVQHWYQCGTPPGPIAKLQYRDPIYT